ncbi:phosphoribulokinase [Marinobacter xestospongiae]|uniref:phosphoribulokinase n=1 Tax=Marinobacter xestospongiae TaxID=994319 RepID=A0ABU3VWD9_9GAMM|nr:phosphoribulokinase [Marinobacter xestospongiae]MCK7567295.1 phosphoribulokinase [Marinobacter xestospongiae]MDV2078579.1 phosphoribulokinase [Marinobacter xestospongiae]
MSRRHPIIAVTGSSGAGTTTTGQIFSRLFAAEGIHAAMVSGDSFHRYNREQMARLAAKGQFGERNHFALAANHIDKLEALFYDYCHTGSGQSRQYVHDEDRALIASGHKPGTFTPWEALPADTDLLFYEGLHGGVVSDSFNTAQYVDLLIGVVPIVNLEWIQKIHRDTFKRGYSQDAVVTTIINRMDDYVHDIVPQFSHTHINFQRIPLVDTSNPFVAREVPTDDESMIVIHFRDPLDVDFPYLLQMIAGSSVSRHDTLVIPGTKLSLAMDLIMRPMVQKLMQQKPFA